MRLLLAAAFRLLVPTAIWGAVLTGCTSSEAAGLADAGSHADPTRTARDMVKNGAVLLDVRTRGEFGGGHIEGAVNIPVEQLAQRMGELDPNKPIVVYCRSGRRSRIAKDLLLRNGFGQVLDLGSQSNW